MTASSRRLGLASIVALSLLAAALPLRAQIQAASPQGDAIPTVPPAAVQPTLATAPQTGSENPFRRFEIVSLGSFPILLFYSDFSFDLGRYFANGFDSAYTPWPFKNQYSAPISDSERLTRIGAALGASIVVGAIDAYIHNEKSKKAKRLREARDALGALPSEAP
jgi:hypothetical protein